MNNITKETLANGLDVLVAPKHESPEVSVQLWYNVGSKHEKDGERGMAHLLEHMTFKGTKRLSESDINLITHKFAGYTNAFTSYDYTTYVYRFPSSTWEIALFLLADCMRGCRIDEQMLSSEVKAVIAEMKMGRDDYQDYMCEKLLSSLFLGTPYQHPIIGYKYDLLNLRAGDLRAFYNEHYFPANATLVIVGDVDPGHALVKAREHFEGISSDRSRIEIAPFWSNLDGLSTTLRLMREVEQPWSTFVWRVPGLKSGQGYLVDLVGQLFAGGQSSRLYERLVIKDELAADVEPLRYELIDGDVLYFNVLCHDEENITPIGEAISEEVERVVSEGACGIAPWEVSRLKNNARMTLYDILENNDEHATEIGNLYLATQDEHALEHLQKRVALLQPEDLVLFTQEFLHPALMSSGEVLCAEKEDERLLLSLQEASDVLDREILAARVRSVPVEEGSFVKIISVPKIDKCPLPVYRSKTLEGGLEVVSVRNLGPKKVAILLGFQGNYVCDSWDARGLSNMHARMLLEGTKRHKRDELHRMLEEYGMHLESESGVLSLEVPSELLERGLAIVAEIVTMPRLDCEAFEAVRDRTLSEIGEFWDDQLCAIEQLAEQQLYGRHPYANPELGTTKTLKALRHAEVLSYQQKYMTPKGSILSLVGNFEEYSDDDLDGLILKYFGSWRGYTPPLVTAPVVFEPPCGLLSYPKNRDQVALCFVAPSTTFDDPDFVSLLVLDSLLIGGENGSMSAKLFALREASGLFYTISGSLVHRSGRFPGSMLVKTLVSEENVYSAISSIQKVFQEVSEGAFSDEEIHDAIRAVKVSLMEYFKTNIQTASTFHLVKKLKKDLQLFDKLGDMLAILKLEHVRSTAHTYCRPELFTVLKLGRG